jgi:hypothetical protein
MLRQLTDLSLLEELLAGAAGETSLSITTSPNQSQDNGTPCHMPVSPPASPTGSK